MLTETPEVKNVWQVQRGEISSNEEALNLTEDELNQIDSGKFRESLEIEELASVPGQYNSGLENGKYFAGPLQENASDTGDGFSLTMAMALATVESEYYNSEGYAGGHMHLVTVADQCGVPNTANTSSGTAEDLAKND